MPKNPYYTRKYCQPSDLGWDECGPSDRMKSSSPIVDCAYESRNIFDGPHPDSVDRAVGPPCTEGYKNYFLRYFDLIFALIFV